MDKTHTCIKLADFGCAKEVLLVSVDKRTLAGRVYDFFIQHIAIKGVDNREAVIPPLQILDKYT